MKDSRHSQCAYNIIGVYSGTNYSQTYVVTFLNDSLLQGEACNNESKREREKLYVQNILSLLCDNMVGWSLGQIPSLVVWTVRVKNKVSCRK